MKFAALPMIVSPMIISLALCGAAVLAAGEAQAQPNAVAAARAPNGNAAMRAPSAAVLAVRHKQLCQNAYAHQVGDLAYLEARLNLTPAQQPVFDRWKNVKLGIAKRGAADCATRELPTKSQANATVLDDMARQVDNFKRRLDDLNTELPALTAFYNSLNESQKMALNHPGPEAMMDRHRIFADALAPDLDDGPQGAGPQPAARAAAIGLSQ